MWKCGKLYFITLLNLWDLLTNTLTIYDFCPFLFCWLGRMRLTHQLTINRRYLVSGDLRLSFSLSVIRLLVCLSVCYLYAICLPVCYPSVSVSLAYGKMSWHFRISVHPCLSLLSSLILSSLFACLFYPSRSCCVLFTLVTMPYHGISSRTRPQSNGHTQHLFALPWGTKIFLGIDFALHKWRLSKSLFPTLYVLIYKRLVCQTETFSEQTVWTLCHILCIIFRQWLHFTAVSLHHLSVCLCVYYSP